jgi:hypothetical protein
MVCASPARAQAIVPIEGGRFSGDPAVVLLKDGQKVRLAAPFHFSGPTGVDWSVPAGVVVDGASIPQQFWSFIGGPFEGRYRNASIVHDYYCDVRTRSWRDVHRVFYDAMIAGGVERTKAKIMYFAVWRFGPRWEIVNQGNNANGNGTVGNGIGGGPAGGATIGGSPGWTPIGPLSPLFSQRSNYSDTSEADLAERRERAVRRFERRTFERTAAEIEAADPTLAELEARADAERRAIADSVRR